MTVVAGELLVQVVALDDGQMQGPCWLSATSSPAAIEAVETWSRQRRRILCFSQDPSLVTLDGGTTSLTMRRLTDPAAAP